MPDVEATFRPRLNQSGPFLPESGAVTSVFGRVGAVVAVAGDYTSDEVDNLSGVAGATVSDALETLDAEIGALPSGSLPANVDKSAASAGVAVTLSRADHKHDTSTAAPAAGAVAVGNVAAEGAASTLARSDHTHAVAAGVPVATGLANSAGAASTFARSDHVHATAGTSSIPNQSGIAGASATDALNNLGAAIVALPSNVAPLNVDKSAASAGVSVNLSRDDHKHDTSTAAPPAGAVAVGNVAAEGVATTLARSDHTHAVAAGVPVSVDKSANAAGAASSFARSDHKHDASTAAPPAGAVAVGNAAAEGAATTLARSDHTHAVAAGVPVTTGTANAAGAASTFSRSDHVHQTAGSTSVPNQSGVAGATTTDALNALNAAVGAASNSVRMLGASDLDEPNSANWAITAIAVISADSLNAMIVNRNFDDTIEQGIGFDLPIPAGAVNMTIGFISRAQTAPGAAAAVQPRLYRRQIPDNAAVGAWSAALSLALLAIPTNTNFQYDTETISLATLGLTAGLNAFFELTRQGAAAGDTLAGNWNLYAIKVSFS